MLNLIVVVNELIFCGKARCLNTWGVITFAVITVAASCLASCVMFGRCFHGELSPIQQRIARRAVQLAAACGGPILIDFIWLTVAQLMAIQPECDLESVQSLFQEGKLTPMYLAVWFACSSTTFTLTCHLVIVGLVFGMCYQVCRDRVWFAQVRMHVEEFLAG